MQIYFAIIVELHLSVAFILYKKKTSWEALHNSLSLGANNMTSLARISATQALNDFQPAWNSSEGFSLWKRQFALDFTLSFAPSVRLKNVAHSDDTDMQLVSRRATAPQ